MTADFQPIRGEARIELSDVMPLSLGWHLKRLGLLLLVLGAFAGYLMWRVFSMLDVTPSGLSPPMNEQAMSGLRASFLQMGLVTVLLFASFLLLRIVILPWIALWRTGSERRTFSWVIDETGIRRTDALGAQSLLPWSNVSKITSARRVFWLHVKPRGRLFLLRRAFTVEDQARVHELALRLIGQ